MDSNLILGAICIAAGVYYTVVRAFWPHQLGKLEPMKKAWGEKRGYAVHVFGYSVLPILFGIVFIIVSLSK